jgi:DNA-binding transcriptional regulator GbsR (MarR family)
LQYMKNEILSSEKRDFIENVGLLIEKTGIQRMAGRILGLLLISEKPYLSIGEITEILPASKGSVSTMIRTLLRGGIVERVVLPGERRDYFTVKQNFWPQFIKENMLMLTQFRKLAEQGLNLIKDSEPARVENLEQFRDIFDFLENSLHTLLKKWDERNRNK